MQILLVLLSLVLLCGAVPLHTGLAAAQSPKLVVAHFMVGNTYPYTVNDWAKDMTLAASKGFDAFALNVGVDPWQPQRVADAYAAAKTISSNGTDFKLFLSFDMTSLPCGAANDADLIRKYIADYHMHPNQLLYNNKTLVSTFSGENCRFGTGSLEGGWMAAIKASSLPPVYFIPSFFVDPLTFSSLPVMDGAFNWNGAWPAGNYEANFTSDEDYITNLGNRSYMAGVSPWFFTHYGAASYNKNFIYRGDDWLISKRWELLIENRDSIALAQVMTWNDYGESHYIGPIDGAQPNSQAWTNGYDHQGWLDLIEYYITAFKTGTYPPVAHDRFFLWARLYPASANAQDAVGKPTGWQWTQDYLWAVIFLTAPTRIALTCGSSNNTIELPAGISKLELPLISTCNVNASMSRDGSTILDFAPVGFTFSTNPSLYNFNAFVAAS